MKTLFMICADNVVQDVRTNSISIFNVIEDLTSDSFPRVLPRASLAALLERHPDESGKVSDATLEIYIDEERLFVRPVNIDFQDKWRTRVLITIGGLLIPRPGHLVFRIVAADNELAAYPVLVRATEPTHQQLPLPMTYEKPASDEAH